MASKLTIKTKLTDRKPESSNSEKVGLIKKTGFHPRSYRWRESDLELIRQVLESVNSISSRKIDATKALRGALVIALKTKPEKLLEAIVEAERKSLLY